MTAANRVNRRPSPDQELGPGKSLWASAEAVDMLFEVAKAEQRSVKVVLLRALQRYAEQSEDYQDYLATKKPRRKAA